MKIIIALLLGFISFSAFAAGFDINNFWSAKYAATGSAAVSNVEGAQSVYFNPAGLSKSYKLEIDVNINTSFIQKAAPLVSDGTSSTSGKTSKHTPLIYNPIFGFFYGKQVNSRLGIGAGLYAAGGSGGKYNDVSFGNDFTALKPDIESGIFLVEMGLGAGYQLTPALSIGFAWRPTFISLNSSAAVATPGLILVAPELQDLSGVVWDGFRLGMQYRPVDANWGLGVALRSENEFSAKGKSGGHSEVAGSGTKDSINGGDVTAKSKIPMRLSFGGHYDPNPKWRLMTQYDFTRNERAKTLKLSGDPLVINGPGNVPINTPISGLSVPLNWKNQNTFRFGTQYKLPEVWTVRAGYVFSTQAVEEDRASPTEFTPGDEQSFSVGGGREIRLFDKLMTLDLTLEYVQIHGMGKNSKTGSLDGVYDSRGVGFYTAVSYRL